MCSRIDYCLQFNPLKYNIDNQVLVARSGQLSSIKRFIIFLVGQNVLLGTSFRGYLGNLVQVVPAQPRTTIIFFVVLLSSIGNVRLYTFMASFSDYSLQLPFSGLLAIIVVDYVIQRDLLYINLWTFLLSYLFLTYTVAAPINHLVPFTILQSIQRDLSWLLVGSPSRRVYLLTRIQRPSEFIFFSLGNFPSFPLQQSIESQ